MMWTALHPLRWFTLLQRYTSNIDFYIPDRYTEGYGISYQGVITLKVTAIH